MAQADLQGLARQTQEDYSTHISSLVLAGVELGVLARRPGTWATPRRRLSQSRTRAIGYSGDHELRTSIARSSLASTSFFERFHGAVLFVDLTAKKWGSRVAILGVRWFFQRFTTLFD